MYTASVTALMGLATSLAFSPSRYGAPPPSALNYAVDENHIDQPRPIWAPYVLFLDDPFYQAPHHWMGQEQMSITVSAKIVDGESEVASQDTVTRKKKFLAPEHFDMQVQREVLASLFQEQEGQQKMTLVSQVSVEPLNDDDSMIKQEAEGETETVVVSQREHETKEVYTTNVEFAAPSMEERIARGVGVFEEMAVKRSSENEAMVQEAAPVTSKINQPVDPVEGAKPESSAKVADCNSEQLHVSVTTTKHQSLLNNPDPAVFDVKSSNDKDVKNEKIPLSQIRTATVASVSRPPNKQVVDSVQIKEELSPTTEERATTEVRTTKIEEMLMAESKTTTLEVSTEISKHKNNDNKAQRKKEITLVEGGLAAMALVGLTTAVGLEVSTLVDVAMLGVAVGAFSSVMGSPKKRSGDLMEENQMSLISPSSNQTAVLVD